MRWVKWRDLSCYSNKIESVSFRKCPYDHWHNNKMYLSAITVTKHLSEFLPTRRWQKSTGIDMEQNNVTVTLCIVYVVVDVTHNIRVIVITATNPTRRTGDVRFPPTFSRRKHPGTISTDAVIDRMLPVTKATLGLLRCNQQYHCTKAMKETKRVDRHRLNSTFGSPLSWSTTWLLTSYWSVNHALLLPTLLSDSQVLISLVIRGLWITVSGQA